jgi:chorismate mutase
MVDRDQNGNVKPGLTIRLKQMSEKVLGLAVFQGREKVRERDKILRDHIADRLEVAKEQVNKFKQALLGKMQLGLLSDADRVTSQLDRLREKIRHETYGYTGAFDETRILDPELNKLYDYDLQLLDKVESFVTAGKALPGEQAAEQEAKAAVDALRVELSALAELIDRRRDALLNLSGKEG